MAAAECDARRTVGVPRHCVELDYAIERAAANQLVSHCASPGVNLRTQQDPLNCLAYSFTSGNGLCAPTS
jgi:hypothetical protein